MSTEFCHYNNGKQIIVTGATGFIGQHTIPILLENNFNIVAIARDINKAKTFDWFSSVSFFPFDIYKDVSLLKVEAGAGLIHLAWKNLPNYHSLFHFEENLPKSYDFIKYLVMRGVENVLVSGTCFEYGLQSGPLGINATTQPSNPYALAKDTLRKYLCYFKAEVPFQLKWARLFYLYGSGQSPQSIIPLLDQAIDRGDSIFNMSGGEQLRDYLPVEEAAKKLVEIFISREEGVFNICSGQPISVRRLVEQRIQERGANIKINLGALTYSDHEPMAFWGG